MKETTCPCPYVPCEIRGNCAACIAKSRKENELPNCMEAIAVRFGAKLPVNTPKTEVVKDYQAMSRRCAELIRDCISIKKDALLCFPAGSTVERTCELLVDMKKAGEIDFSQCHFVALDEWVGLSDRSEDCTSFLMKRLYEPLGIREDQLSLFDPKAKNLTDECKRIDRVIFAHGGIDFMLLGVGMNGHLGLNEPGDSFDSYAKVVKLSETTAKVGQKYFKNGMKLTGGITLGMKHIFEAKTVVLQISGEAKSEIVYKIYNSLPTQEIPATALALMPGGLVVADEAAMGSVKV